MNEMNEISTRISLLVIRDDKYNETLLNFSNIVRTNQLPMLINFSCIYNSLIIIYYWKEEFMLYSE